MPGLKRFGLLIGIICSLWKSCLAQFDWNSIQQYTIGSDSIVVGGDKVIVTGNIVNKNTKEPIVGATISVDSYKYFDYSDNNGQYKLELPAGNYKIIVRHVGLVTSFYRWNVVSGGLFNFDLEEGTFSLESIVVSARAPDLNIKQAIAGISTVPIESIKSLPNLMGEVDIVKALQLMPGVTSVGEVSTGFNVRGGRPDQNLILINSAPVFNASHALGFVSSFNQDIIKDFNLYKGTVPASHGGRASSVLEINTKKASYDDWTFNAGVGPLTARLAGEGPIQKSKSSILFSGRVAYPGWILKKAENPQVSGSNASFNDLFTSISYKTTNSSSLEFNLNRSYDKFQFSDRFAYEWTNFLSQINWRAYADKKASPLITLSYGKFKTMQINPVGPLASTLSDGINYVQLKPIVNYAVQEKLTFVGGAEAILYLPQDEILSGYKNPAFKPKRVNKDNGLETSLFINSDYQINDRISTSIGLRATYYMHLGPDSIFQYLPDQPKNENNLTDTVIYSSLKKIKTYHGIEPRASLRILTFKNQSVKISYNRMFQYIHQISNTTSVTPVDVWQVSTGYVPPQKADNYSIGYFWNLKNNSWETSAEFFYKTFNNLVEYKDFPNLYANTHLETELITAIGKSHGLELFVRKIKGLLTGWLSYTYSQTMVKTSSPYPSESINNGNWFPSKFNKPHMVNLALTKRGYGKGSFSIIASYASGRPMTAIETSYMVNNAITPVYSQRNQYNIPDYFRVDISLTIGTLLKRFDDSVVLSLYNIFGRQNAYSIFYQRPTSNYYIPKPYKLSILGSTLPSITYNIKF